LGVEGRGREDGRMNDETTTDGLRLCEWCGSPIRNQPATGRLRDYCRQSCRQRAYEERRQQKRIADALAAATYAPAPAPVSSRDVEAQVEAAPVSPRDETLPAQRRPRRVLKWPLRR
jgi:hypothetical protein